MGLTSHSWGVHAPPWNTQFDVYSLSHMLELAVLKVRQREELFTINHAGCGMKAGPAEAGAADAPTIIAVATNVAPASRRTTFGPLCLGRLIIYKSLLYVGFPRTSRQLAGSLGALVVQRRRPAMSAAAASLLRLHSVVPHVNANVRRHLAVRMSAGTQLIQRKRNLARRRSPVAMATWPLRHSRRPRRRAYQVRRRAPRRGDAGPRARRPAAFGPLHAHRL